MEETNLHGGESKKARLNFYGGGVSIRQSICRNAWEREFSGHRRAWMTFLFDRLPSAAGSGHMPFVPLRIVGDFTQGGPRAIWLASCLMGSGGEYG